MAQIMIDLVEIPFSFQGKIFRSPMPFSKYDISRRVWCCFLENNIRSVLVLATRNEMLNHTGKDLRAFYLSEGLRINHYPIPDYGVPSNCDELNKIIDDVIATAQSGDNLVVHCLAGIGRTGLFLAILAKTHLKLSSGESIDWIRSYLPGAIENIHQEQFVHQFPC
jgi:hypothetical protein